MAPDPRRMPGDRAEIRFADPFVEYLADLPYRDRVSVLSEVVRLCENPAGAHSLSNKATRLAGWNTVDVLSREHRVVFRSGVENGVGVIDVLCAGPRRADAVYDMAAALAAGGKLTADETADLWDALTLVDVIAEEVGLDGWDYAPEPADPGMVKSAVAAGVLDEKTASVLSKNELIAAMSDGWDADGPDPTAAMQAAMRHARAGVAADPERILRGREEDRCAQLMPRAHAACIRRAQHPGAHRSHG